MLPRPDRTKAIPAMKTVAARNILVSATLFLILCHPLSLSLIVLQCIQASKYMQIRHKDERRSPCQLFRHKHPPGGLCLPPLTPADSSRPSHLWPSSISAMTTPKIQVYRPHNSHQVVGTVLWVNDLLIPERLQSARCLLFRSRRAEVKRVNGLRC
jgi:hypothetical protein